MDGPLIPGSMFFIDKNAAGNRTFSPISIAILNTLCERSGAKVVMNTSHNYDSYKSLLRDDMIKAGFKEEYFHRNWRTQFGSKDWGNRYDCINEWVAGNTKEIEIDWVCFDDLHFTKDYRLITVEYDVGITPKHFETALDILKIDNSGLIL